MLLLKNYNVTSVSQQDYPVNRREQLRRYGMFAELG